MNVTIARITARGLLGRRRVLLLLPLPLLLIGLAILANARGATLRQWGPAVIVGLGFGVILPVVALVIGTGVLGSEIDDGTVVHILAKPLSRTEIILSKLAVAIVATAVTVGGSMFAVGLVAGSTKLGIGLAVGAVVGSVAYSALFLMLSLLTRRPVLIGLAYVLIWEGLLVNLLSGTRMLSIEQYVIAVADRVASSDVLQARLSLPVALSMAAVIAVGATVLAIDRLRSFTLTGETS